MTVSDLGFTLDRTYAATPERVYAYFTDPELMARWFCPNPDLPTTCDLDVRAGGAWRVVMGEWVVGGSYVEVEPPTRLVFTFDWEHDEDGPTTVTVEITPGGRPDQAGARPRGGRRRRWSRGGLDRRRSPGSTGSSASWVAIEVTAAPRPRGR